MIPTLNKGKIPIGVLRPIMSAALAFSLFAGSPRAAGATPLGAPDAVFACGSFIASIYSASMQQTAPDSSSKPAKHRHTPFDDFLIHGTVFNDKALGFPGVDIRIRRAGEKKFHWQDVTNSRGDFAIRVPYNASYEIVTHAKGFLDQSKIIDAKSGSAEQTLSFQMESAKGKK